MPTIQTGIFSRASANSSSSKLVAQKTASHQLAQSLQVDPGEVTIRGSQTKMMNLSTLGFPVEGELQMSAAGQAVEVKMSVGEEKFVFRGNGESGRLGLDVEHDGFWSKDERGIYTPTESKSDGFGGFDNFGTIDDSVQLNSGWK